MRSTSTPLLLSVGESVGGEGARRVGEIVGERMGKQVGGRMNEMEGWVREWMGYLG